jgi:hypothetical protein
MAGDIEFLKKIIYEFTSRTFKTELDQQYEMIAMNTDDRAKELVQAIQSGNEAILKELKGLLENFSTGRTEILNDIQAIQFEASKISRFNDENEIPPSHLVPLMHSMNQSLGTHYAEAHLGVLTLLKAMYPYFGEKDKEEVRKLHPELKKSHEELRRMLQPTMLSPPLFDRMMDARLQANPDYTILANAWSKAYKVHTPVVIEPEPPTDGNKKGEKATEQQEDQGTNKEST